MSRAAAMRCFAGLIALACAGNAAADARSDLHAAFMKNLSAKTYRATMTDLGTGRQLSTVEFQAPDRYRVTATGAPASVIAEGAMYLQINGKSMRVPLQPGMLEKFRSDAAWKQMESNTLIRELGPALLGTEPARRFHWISSGKNASTGDVWKEPGSKAGAVRVVYSAFDDPAIRIATPK
jgi:hypothetical protein